jgi:hypothetical protein
MIPILLLLAATLTSSGEIPARFEHKSGGSLWVARAKTTALDALRRRDLTETQLESIRSRIEKTAHRRVTTNAVPVDEQCAAVFAGYVASGGTDDFPVGSLARLREIAGTRSVITGNVAAVQAGLHNGQPFSVIAVDTGHTLVYLLYPNAKVEVDGSLICNADPRYAALPRRGEPILFLAAAPVDSAGRLYFVPPDRIFYERDGAVVSAPALALDPDLLNVRSVGQLLERLHPERPPRTAREHE